MEDLISIIVPVFNVELYIERCLKSIVNQTYCNLEIILIDDGSVDASGGLCDLYAKKDTRIKVIHTKNSGLSAARNLGIRNATGKYLTFIDSDDYVSDKYVEHLWMTLKEFNADISISREMKVYDESESIKPVLFSKENTKIYNSQTALSDMLYRKNIPVYAWAKLYKKELFENIEFPSGEIFEDLSTVYLLFDAAQLIVYNPVRDYYYVQRSNSIINSSFNPNKMIQIEIMHRIFCFVKRNYPDIIGAVTSKCFIISLNLYRNIPWNKENRKYRKIVKKEIEKYRWIVLKNKEEKLLTRVIAFCSIINIGVFRCGGIIYQFLITNRILRMKSPV